MPSIPIGSTTIAWDGTNHLRLDATLGPFYITMPDGSLIGTEYGTNKGKRINAKLIAGSNNAVFTARSGQYLRSTGGQVASLTLSALGSYDFEWDGVNTWDVV